MSEPTDPTGPAGMKALGSRLQESRGDASRRDVATRADDIAVRIWPDDPPFIDENAIRDFETRMQNPPGDGRVLRCVLGAVGIRLVDALEVLGYWPDAILAGSRSPAMAVAEALRILGYPNAKLLSAQGRDVTIRL